uniref:Uncharacterized protein n=1 Tax=Rhizophora mucronata TaxID=61149 RepID=A0A2P2L3N7_RHIMU
MNNNNKVLIPNLIGVGPKANRKVIYIVSHLSQAQPKHRYN